MTNMYVPTVSVVEKIEAGVYDPNQVPYPTRVTTPEMLNKRAHQLTDDEIRELPFVREEFNKARCCYNDAIANYKNHVEQLRQDFRDDLEAEFGTTNHPKRDALYFKAEEAKDYDNNLLALYHEYESLVELVR
jgi:hypothetical protein